MSVQISPMLAVSDAAGAIEFYQAAFGATELWRLDAGGSLVAGMAVDGAEFFLASESPENGTRSPDLAGHTTVRIELFVDDPRGAHARALAAGATELHPVREFSYSTVGPRPLSRMLQGTVADPSGHRWLIGKILD
jgi:PhnB protein